MTAIEVMRLVSEALEVEILPGIGGRLHRLRAFGHDLLLTPDDPEAHRADPVFWGAFPMAPWCNRAAPGPMPLLGQTIDLAPNFDDGSAIHGLVLDVPWRVVGDGALEVSRDGDTRWPWSFRVELSIAIEAGAVSLAYRLHNASDRPMPAGIGLHPWFRRPLEVRVIAQSVYRSNTDSAAEPEAAEDRFDLRGGGQPPVGLDGTWTDLSDPTVDLVWPTLGLRAGLEIDAAAPHVAVATPPARDAFAIEPQTHAPDPLRRLAAGERGAPAVVPPNDVLELRLILAVAPLEPGGGPT